MAADFNHFGDVADALPDIVDQIIRKIALDAEAGYKELIQANGQIDTGNMLNSCYSVTSKGSTYQDSPLNTAPPALPGPRSAYAGIAADYAAYQNYGTVSQPARPFFEPTNEQVQAGLQAALNAAHGQLEAFNQ